MKALDYNGPRDVTVTEVEYRATDMSGLQPGDSVVIYGAGPERHSRPHNANQGFPQRRL
jgi:hypothetical protein